MKTVLFSARGDERPLFEAQSAAYGVVPTYVPKPLEWGTRQLVKGARAVSVSAAYPLPGPLLAYLKEQGVRCVAIRAAGYDNIDLQAATAFGLKVCRVPRYSPASIAEFALLLALALLRKLPALQQNIRAGHFATGPQMLGSELAGKTVGIVGSGNIGSEAARLFAAVGCKVLVYSPYDTSDALGRLATPVPWPQLLSQSQLISFHCPLTDETRHMVNAETIGQMRPGALLVNTARGALFDFAAVLSALQNGPLGAVAFDVYEGEENIIRKTFASGKPDDDVFNALLARSDVLYTPHVAFYTEQAVTAIVKTTLENLQQFSQRGQTGNDLN